MAADNRRKGKGAAGPSLTPWQESTRERTVTEHPETGMGLATTDFEAAPWDHHTGEQYSSYPHLTPATETRAEHVTNAFNLGPVADPAGTGRDMALYARVHQDNVPGAPAQFDRFFAADQDTGEVFSATAKLRTDIHQGKFAAAPQRNDPLASIDTGKLSFNVSPKVDEQHPPLSPRSRRRGE